METIPFDPAPESLLQGSELNLGVYRSPLRDVNLVDARLPGSSRWTSRFRMKQWQHWLVVSPELALTLAIVDVGYLKLAWIQAVERSTGTQYEWASKGVMSHCKLSRSLWNEQCCFRQGRREIRFKNELDQGQHMLSFRAAATGDLPAIKGELRALHDLSAIDPLVVCLPVGEGRAMYSHKVPLPVAGEVELDGQHFIFAPNSATAFSDIHKAHYPRHTWWDWACFATHTVDGRMLGLNLTHNLAQQPTRYNENALWVDGQPTRLGLARFERNRADLMQPWRVSTSCGRVDLRFEPSGGRSEDLELGLISSQFHQLYGLWSGTLNSGDENFQVEHAFGLGEDHECRW
jgi:hypothetical protein